METPLNLYFLIPLAPVAGFCVALAIGFVWVEWQEARGVPRSRCGREL
jgi:hypothetical protein